MKTGGYVRLAKGDNKTRGTISINTVISLVEEMKTICHCGKKATFNARFINDKFTIEGDQVAIDGKNKVTYDSVCPRCYYKMLDEYNKEKSLAKN